jgi:hypothetical protein
VTVWRGGASVVDLWSRAALQNCCSWLRHLSDRCAGNLESGEIVVVVKHTIITREEKWVVLRGASLKNKTLLVLAVGATLTSGPTGAKILLPTHHMCKRPKRVPVKVSISRS